MCTNVNLWSGRTHINVRYLKQKLNLRLASTRLGGYIEDITFDVLTTRLIECRLVSFCLHLRLGLGLEIKLQVNDGRLGLALKYMIRQNGSLFALANFAVRESVKKLPKWQFRPA